jgi:hypothetical protein
VVLKGNDYQTLKPKKQFFSGVKLSSLIWNDRSKTQDRPQITISSIRLIKYVKATGVDNKTTEAKEKATNAVGVEAVTKAIKSKINMRRTVKPNLNRDRCIKVRTTSRAINQDEPNKVFKPSILRFVNF